MRLQVLVGRMCESMYVCPYRHSRRLRRECVCTTLCGREIVWVYAYGRVFEALAPRVRVLWIVWAGDSANLCIRCAIRGACAEIVCALDCVGGRFCESMHMGPYRHSRRLRRDCVCSGLCGRESLRVYAYGPLSPFEALAPRVCVLWIVWAGESASLCIWARCDIRGACAESVCALDCVGGRLCKSMHMGPYRHSRRLRCGSGVLIILWRLRG